MVPRPQWIGAVATLAGPGALAFLVTRSAAAHRGRGWHLGGRRGCGPARPDGIRRQWPPGAKRDARGRIRRNHVATMFAVLAVGIVHTALNGPLAGR